LIARLSGWNNTRREVMLTLTGKEIKDLAEAVGLVIQPLNYGDEL